MSLNSLVVTTVVSVSLPVAFGLWFMMYPVLVKVRWESFGDLFKLRDTYKQLAFSVLANWVMRTLVVMNGSEMSAKGRSINDYLFHHC